jgi:hypothetical protein
MKRIHRQLSAHMFLTTTATRPSWRARTPILSVRPGAVLLENARAVLSALLLRRMARIVLLTSILPVDMWPIDDAITHNTNGPGFNGFVHALQTHWHMSLLLSHFCLFCINPGQFKPV